MSGISITVDSEGQSNTSDFTIYYEPPIDLKGLQYRCSMRRLDTYYSWYNISAVNQNNIFKYNNGVDDVVLTIDDGLYSFQNLCDEIQDLMVLQGDYTIVDGKNVFDINFELDLSSGYVTMILTNSFTVDFTGLGIRNIFGFGSANFVVSSTGGNTAKIDNGVNQILVHCSLVNGSSYVNNRSSDVIYSFSSNYQENERIQLEPNSDEYLNLNTRSKIYSIRIHFTDQRFHPISLNQAPVTLRLYLEPMLTEY